MTLSRPVGGVGVLPREHRPRRRRRPISRISAPTPPTALLVLGSCLLMAVGGVAWAKCNSLSITVEGVVEPRVDGALVRVETEPGTPRESVAVWPDADGKFSASLWYSTQVGLGLLGNDCSRRPTTVLVSLAASERALATARLDIRAEFVVDALGNYRTKRRVVLKTDGRPPAE